jgi:hypothetical protein
MHSGDASAKIVALVEQPTDCRTLGDRIGSPSRPPTPRAERRDGDVARRIGGRSARAERCHAAPFTVATRGRPAGCRE